MSLRQQSSNLLADDFDAEACSHERIINAALVAIAGMWRGASSVTLRTEGPQGIADVDIRMECVTTEDDVVIGSVLELDTSLPLDDGVLGKVSGWLR